MSQIDRLLNIMRTLRDPDGGCPWDQAQTYQSIVSHTIEEAYEVADAIERKDYAELRDELGDLLFQVVFYARLAEEQGLFDFHDVVQGIADKLERRHPHVFGDMRFASAEAQTAHWEELKKQERELKATQKVSLLDGIAHTLPALSLAGKLQKRAAQAGFDWPDAQGVFDKLHEEIAELKTDWQDPQRREDELGDLLFTCVNLARHAQADPEAALRHANHKFEQRFRAMEALAEKQGRALAACSADELETLWQAVKAHE